MHSITNILYCHINITRPWWVTRDGVSVFVVLLRNCIMAPWGAFFLGLRFLSFFTFSWFKVLFLISDCDYLIVLLGLFLTGLWNDFAVILVGWDNIVIKFGTFGYFLVQLGIFFDQLLRIEIRSSHRASEFKDAFPTLALCETRFLIVYLTTQF